MPMFCLQWGRYTLDFTALTSQRSSELLAGLENHAPARLCPAQDGVDQADRETLHAWRAAWINDSDHAQRLGILIDGLETVCGG